MGYLDRIVESAQNLLRLLTDILDLTRLEAGESKFSIEPISLTALIYQFAERYRLSAAKKGLGFDLDVDPKLPEYINNDSEKVSRILGSLLDNAVKFTDKGGIRLAVNRSRDLDGRWQVLFTVADTGPGIPKTSRVSCSTPSNRATAARHAATAALASA
jgi:signal transduction histidine kinase